MCFQAVNIATESCYILGYRAVYFVPVRLIFDPEGRDVPSKTSVPIWTTRRYIPEGGNIHNYR
jgi:hypothetical protein